MKRLIALVIAGKNRDMIKVCLETYPLDRTVFHGNGIGIYQNNFGATIVRYSLAGNGYVFGFFNMRDFAAIKEGRC